MSSWREAPPPRLRIGPLGWLRVGWRGGLIGSVTYGGLLVLLLVRLVEWPLCGQARPVTPWITQAVCRFALWVLGLPLVVHGRPMTAPGAIVANHSGWLDIFVLNAAMPVFFVSKAEVAGWPGINILTRVTDTHFVTRDPKLAREQAEEFAARTRKLIEGGRTDLDIEIGVLRDRLAREGLRPAMKAAEPAELERPMTLDDLLIPREGEKQRR